MITLFLLLSLLTPGTDSDVLITEESLPDREAWAPSLKHVFDQLETLDLFAAATKLGGMTIKIPAEFQKLPARMVEGADELRARGIDIYLKELQFKDLNFIYEKTPEWPDDRPAVPTLVQFGRLGFSAEAKTNRMTIPLGATFENGQLPVDFLPMLEKGFDLNLMPEARAEDTDINTVHLKVGGPVVSGIANRFFSKKVAALILEHGVGQTLQMGQQDLITGDAASRLLDIRPDSRRGQAVQSLVDTLLR